MMDRGAPVRDRPRPRDADPRRGAVLAILATAMLWGTTGAAQELGAAGAAPFTVAASRSLLGGIGLLAVVVASGQAAELGRIVRRATVAAAGASAGMAIFALGYLTAVREIGVGLGTLATIGCAPVWAGLLGIAAGRRPGRRWWIATGLAVTGAAVLLLPGADPGTGAGSTVVGVTAGMTAGAAYAAYTTVSKRVLDTGAAPTAAIAVSFAGSALILAPLLAYGDLGWLTTVRGLATLTWLGLGTIVVGYVLFGRALRVLDAPTVTTFTLAEPLTATVLGIVVLAERPTATGLAGGALLAVGLLLVGGRPARSPIPDPPGRWASPRRSYPVTESVHRTRGETH
jgi:drug/metabolite transporter, DME family